jgi:hypothetical protein
VYVRSNTNAVTGLSAILTTDAAGVPDHLILTPAGRADPMVFQETSSGAQPGRWVSFPVGRWLTAGDYWIGFQCTGAGIDIANDGSGSDVYWTSGGSYASGTYYNSAKTTGSVKYSIRASIQTTGVGGGVGSDAILGVASAGGARISGLSGSSDIDVAGANDHEFNSSTIGGTTLGSPTVMDADTTVRSNLYIKADSVGGLSLDGVYWTAPSIPFTVRCKLSDYLVIGGNARAGLALIETGPAKLLTIGFGGNNSRVGDIYVDAWTNRTSYGGVVVGQNYQPVQYLGFIVSSSTVVQAQFSLNGKFWWNDDVTHNPGFTIAHVGLYIDRHSSGQATEAAFDWIRFT